MVVTSEKEAARHSVDAAADQLVTVSHELWDNPETAFEEFHSAEVCSDALDRAGFHVTSGVGGLETSFVAEFGTGELVIGICAEYDALPHIGHACGHNMIAASAIGAGLGLAGLADDLGITVRVYGTPAEEGGGGKILMVEQGAFDGVHLAMMVHPSPMESDVFPTLASSKCCYRLHGKNAHASLAPHLGINAADAVTIAQVAMGLLRQHLDPGDQIHGIVTRGGEAPNVVPALAEANYVMRAPNLEALMKLEPRVHRCFEAGAHATGATLEIESFSHGRYSEFTHDDALAASYRANAQEIGRVFTPPRQGAAGSTDMANLSLLMPAIHPSLALNCAPHVNHQPEFAAHCRTEEADKVLIDGAIGMAWTCIDAATDPTMRERFLQGDTTYGGRDTYPWS